MSLSTHCCDYVRAALDAGGAACVTKARLASDLIAASTPRWRYSVLSRPRFIQETIHNRIFQSNNLTAMNEQTNCK